jgi:hypothetical protein
MIVDDKIVFAGGSSQWAKQGSQVHFFEIELLAAYAAGVQFEVWGAPYDVTGCAPDLTKQFKLNAPFDACPWLPVGAVTPWLISLTAPNVAPTLGQVPIVTGQYKVFVPFGFMPSTPYLTLKPVGAAANVVASYEWGQ